MAKTTEILNRKEDRLKMVDNTIDHVHRTRDIIEYTCQICGIKSNNKFKVYRANTLQSARSVKMVDCAVLYNTPIDYDLTTQLRSSKNRQQERELLEKAAEDEREKADKMLRIDALRERRKLALAGVKLEQQFQQQKRQLEVQREQEARMVVQAKARALRKVNHSKMWKKNQKNRGKNAQAICKYEENFRVNFGIR